LSPRKASALPIADRPEAPRALKSAPLPHGNSKLVERRTIDGLGPASTTTNYRLHVQGKAGKRKNGENETREKREKRVSLNWSEPQN
jgi:hypothetical protein